MLTTVRTNLTLHQRVKLVIVAALLTLSLGLGMATTAQSAGAKAAPLPYPPHPPIIKGLEAAPPTACRITPGGWWVVTEGSNPGPTELPCTKA